MQEGLPEDAKNIILNKREHIMTTVNQYIDSILYPRRKNIMNPFKENFEEVLSIQNILMELNITEVEYYNALSILWDSNFQVQIKPEPNACFINIFFTEGLQAWKANISSKQPVVNHYDVVTYMCAYFSKSKDETFEVMKHTAKEALYQGNK